MGSGRLHILFPWRGFEYGVFSSFLGEMIGLFILFVLWIVGAAISSVRLCSLTLTMDPLTLTLSRVDLLGGARLVPRVPRVPHPHGARCLRVDRLGHDPIPPFHHDSLRCPEPCAVLADAWAIRSTRESLRQGPCLNTRSLDEVLVRVDHHYLLGFGEITKSRSKLPRRRHRQYVVVIDMFGLCCFVDPFATVEYCRLSRINHPLHLQHE